MDNIDEMFGRLRGSAFTAMGVDPNATVYETQEAGVAPTGFLDSLDRYSAPQTITGVYNGNFGAPTKDPTANIDNATNILPGFTFTQASGTAITAKWVADTGSGSGGIVRFTMVAGSAGDHSYLEAIVPIVAGKDLSIGYVGHIEAGNGSGSAPTNTQTYIEGQFLKSDGVTTTGSSNTSTSNLNLAGFLFALPQIQADAGFLRIRFGVKRNAAGTGATGSIDLYVVHREIAAAQVFLQDVTTPANLPGVLVQTGGSLFLYPLSSTANGQVFLTNAAAILAMGFTQLRVNSGSVAIDSGSLLIQQGSTPATPPSGYGVLWVNNTGHLHFMNDAGTNTAIT